MMSAHNSVALADGIQDGWDTHADGFVDEVLDDDVRQANPHNGIGKVEVVVIVVYKTTG